MGARSTDITAKGALTFARVLGAQIGQSIAIDRATTRIGRSEQRYRTIMERANDAMFIVSLDGFVREVNTEGQRLLGQPAEQIVGRKVLDFAGPSTVKQLAEEFERATSRAAHRSGPVELKTARGTAMVEFSSSLVDVGGETHGLGIGRDVTEALQTRSHLIESDRMASGGILASGVAHEINNPLASVMANVHLAAQGVAQFVKSNGKSAELEQVRDELHDASEGADRIRNIVRDLKIFSRGWFVSIATRRTR
jgi:PAS domain S-box-containing protein